MFGTISGRFRIILRRDEDVVKVYNAVVRVSNVITHASQFIGVYLLNRIRQNQPTPSESRLCYGHDADHRTDPT